MRGSGIREVNDDEREGGGGAKNIDESLPYSVELVSGDVDGKYIITYPCPAEVVGALCARQVLARGSCFDITPSRDQRVGVQTIVETTDPEGEQFLF